MTARELEAELLTRCTIAARAVSPTAKDQCDANVFQLAAMVVRSQFPAESTRLMQASERYFATHPNEQLALGDVIKNGWVINLPRLRDMMSHQLHGR